MEHNIRSSKTLLTKPRINPASRWRSSGCVSERRYFVFTSTLFVCAQDMFTHAVVWLLSVTARDRSVCIVSLWTVMSSTLRAPSFYGTLMPFDVIAFMVFDVKQGLGLVKFRTSRNKCFLSRPSVFRRLLTISALVWNFTQRRTVIQYRRFKKPVPSSGVRQSKTTWPLK